jgi:hypothetical protein
MCICAACLALLTAAALDLNDDLLGGGGLPWIDPANATQPGIDVDVMLLLVARALCAANGQAILRRRRLRQGGANGRMVTASQQANAYLLRTRLERMSLWNKVRWSVRRVAARLSRPRPLPASFLCG